RSLRGSDMMLRRRLTLALVLAGMVAPSVARGQEDEAHAGLSPELRFLQGLRERGYHDLALDYLNDLRQSPGTSAELRAVLDYEEGRGLLEEASRMADLEARAAQLDKARARLDAFA